MIEEKEKLVCGWRNLQRFMGANSTHFPDIAPPKQPKSVMTSMCISGESNMVLVSEVT